MSTTREKLLQYLAEAQAAEEAQASTLRTHIAMTPRGEYRSDLGTHLSQTKRHIQMLKGRSREVGWSFNPRALGVGVIENVVGQVLALGKAPIDIARGLSLEEKLLRNAKDLLAGEAVEIASFTALEAVARDCGDPETAELALRLRREEERFFEFVLAQIPTTATAVVEAEVRGRDGADLRTIGAVDKARSAHRRVVTRARRVESGTVRTARAAARRTERAAEGAERSVRKGASSTTRRTRRTVAAAAGASDRRREPWTGYDEQTADQITSQLGALPRHQKDRVRAYEEQNKDRQTVIAAAQADA